MAAFEDDNPDTHGDRHASRLFRESALPMVIEDLEGVILDLNSEAERAYG